LIASASSVDHWHSDVITKKDSSRAQTIHLRPGHWSSSHPKVAKQGLWPAC
jgi:hypothetical protein